MQTKTDKLLFKLRNGDVVGALSIANTFRMLGEHKEAIRSAHAAIQNPNFYRQIDKDPEELKRKGVDALLELYGHRINQSTTGEL